MSVSMKREGNPEGCEADCEEHSGHVRCVRVIDEDRGKNWGCFWYCGKAVREDKRRGFAVTEV